MYSVVLMVALANGPAVPTLSPEQVMAGQRIGSHPAYRGHGCHGCHGCYGGCYGGGCYGGCHGCYGGCYGGGCYGGGCWGCYGGGCYGGGIVTSGCWGGGPVPATTYGPPAKGTHTEPPAVTTPPRKGGAEEEMKKEDGPPKKEDGPPKKEDKKDEEKGETAAPAQIQVHLPADATLTVDEAPTTSTSAIRTFVSPPLPSGKSFHYTLKATVVRDGQTLEISKRVPVSAGKTAAVTLDMRDAQVAQK